MNTKQHAKIRKRSKLNNAVAANPLLGKGGRHETTAKVKRAQEKIQLKKTWFERAAANAAAGSNYVVQYSEFRCCL